MIVIKAELWPFGSEEHKQNLGHATIVNDGSGDNSTGNYKVTLFTKHEKPRVWKVGNITGFPRLKLGAWDLLYRGLKSLVGDRNE